MQVDVGRVPQRIQLRFGRLGHFPVGTSNRLQTISNLNGAVDQSDGQLASR